MKARARLASLLLGLSIVAGTAPDIRAETFTIDPVHSAVLYRAGHFGVSHSWGRFSDISGTLSLDDPNAENNSIDITVKATSIDSGAAARDEHLRGPDFLNAKQFPTITFKSTQIKAVDPNTLEVTGNLTIHGVTKPVTLKVERVGAGKSPMGGSAIGLETTFKINRSDFDMKNMLNAIPDEVMLIVSLEAGHK
jgi:polyisoprenoid-binding protein YceI